MKYSNIIHGTFHSRPNRFIAKVSIDDVLETVHVKNTGRCKDLLVPGAKVILEVSDNPARKTKYDLIAVYKDGLGLVNIDSQLCNKVVAEWLATQGYDYIKPEFTYGASRVDFYMEKNGEKYLMEVKGCTLEIDGVGYFPDAPTERGVKHVKELIRARGEGYMAYILFIVQMEGMRIFMPNDETHREFGDAMREAEREGTAVLAWQCHVTADSLEVSAPLPVDLC